MAYELFTLFAIVQGPLGFPLQTFVQNCNNYLSKTDKYIWPNRISVIIISSVSCSILHPTRRLPIHTIPLLAYAATSVISHFTVVWMVLGSLLQTSDICCPIFWNNKLHINYCRCSKHSQWYYPPIHPPIHPIPVIGSRCDIRLGQHNFHILQWFECSSGFYCNLFNARSFTFQKQSAFDSAIKQFCFHYVSTLCSVRSMEDWTN